MINEQQMVQVFHELFDCCRNTQPIIPDQGVRELRVRLLEEEVSEFAEAAESGDLAHIAKELADILYVTYGAACAFGIDLELVFHEVHRSNMTKIGGTKREDGKILKPATYSPANIHPIIEKQLAELVYERPVCNECA